MRMFINSMVAKTGWQVFTPDNHLTPIFQYKLFNRLAEPGFSPINPFVESAYPAIKTSIRVGNFLFDEALSDDSIPMEIQLTILFKFDPRGCDNKIIAQFALVGDEVFTAIIEDYARQGLMQLISRYRAEELKEARVQNEMKNALFRSVNADVAVLGLSIPVAGCITFQRLVPHARYVRTQLENANLFAKLKQLKLVDEKTVDLLVRTDALHTLEHIEGGMFFADLARLLGQSPPEQPRLFPHTHLPQDDRSSGFAHNGKAEAD